MYRKKEIKQDENTAQYKLDNASIDKLFAESNEVVTTDTHIIKSEIKTVNGYAVTGSFYPKKKVETNDDMAMLGLAFGAVAFIAWIFILALGFALLTSV